MVAKVFITPFAKNGDVEAVPDARQLDGNVSYDAGFGADYDRQLGVDPQAKNIERENFNAVQLDVTTALQEMQSGLGLPPFSLTFAAALPGAGYPRAAIVPRADGYGYWQNQNAGASTADPTVTGSGWVPLNVSGTFTQVLTNANVTLSPSNAAFRILIFTGALTANVNVVLPNWAGYAWVVDNRCTGAFAATVSVAAGTAVAVPLGVATPVYCDGVNIKLGVALLQATETAAGIAEIATQAEVDTGTDDQRIVTPLKLRAAQATQSEAEAGTDNKKLMTPLRAAQSRDIRIGSAGGFSFRRLNHNGNFNINQRSYVSGTATTAASQLTLDRWKVKVLGQSVTFSASGTGNSIVAPAGGLEEVIEGRDISGGTYCASWIGAGTLTVNGVAAAKGTSFTLPANTNATIVLVGAVSQFQIELGTIPTVFEFWPVAVELAICQRYCYVLDNNGENVFAGWGVMLTTTTVAGIVTTLPVNMRAKPTINSSPGDTGTIQAFANAPGVAGAITTIYWGGNTVTYSCSSSTSQTASLPCGYFLQGGRIRLVFSADI